MFIGKKLLNICLGSDFQGMTPKAQTTKEKKINEQDYIKLKSCNTKETTK